MKKVAKNTIKGILAINSIYVDFSMLKEIIYSFK